MQHICVVLNIQLRKRRKLFLVMLGAYRNIFTWQEANEAAANRQRSKRG